MKTGTLETWKLSAREIVLLLREQKVSALDLIDVAETRWKEKEPGINAVPIQCFARARQKAESLSLPSKPGPGYLYGAGHSRVAHLRARKTILQGSLIFKDRVADENDPHVEILERNGAIIIGKSNLPEFGAGANTFNQIFGDTRNPWDLSCTCGGSSGGTAAALAAGEVWLGTGADLGGSLRIPASFCGVVGMRPSVGLVPQSFSAFTELKIVSGPMARNVGDLALMLDAMCGQHPRDPESIAPPPVSFQDALANLETFPKARIAWSSNLGGITPVNREVVERCRTAVDWFKSQGVDVAAACPDLSDAADIFQVLRGHHFAGWGQCFIEDDQARALMKPDLVWQIEMGLKQSKQQVEDARTALKALQARVDAFFQEYDFLCTPCVMVPPFDVKRRWVEEFEGRRFENYVEWLVMTFAISLVDNPALSLPCGLTSGGLPIGLQIVGRHRQDASVLRLAALYETAHGWKDMVPLP